jgi:hypothetical protein
MARAISDWRGLRAGAAAVERLIPIARCTTRNFGNVALRSLSSTMSDIVTHQRLVERKSVSILAQEGAYLFLTAKPRTTGKGLIRPPTNSLGESGPDN